MSGRIKQRLVRPDLVAHLGLALLGAEEHVLVDDDPVDVGADLGAVELGAGQGELARGLCDPALGRRHRGPLLLQAEGGGRIELAQRLLALAGVGPGLAQLEGTPVAEEGVAFALGQLQVLLRPRELLLGPLQLGAGDEALAQQGLQVVEGALCLLQLAFGVGDRGHRLLLLDPALALLRVLELEVAPLDLQAGRRQVFLVLDDLQLQLLLGLRELRLRLLEQGLVAPDLFLEGRRVEEDQEIALLHELSLRGEGDDLGLVALDGGGVGHGPEGLQGPALHDRDLERSLPDGRGGDAGRPFASREEAREDGESRRGPGGRRPHVPGGGGRRRGGLEVLARPGLAAEPGSRVGRGLAGGRLHLLARAVSEATQLRNREGGGAHGVAPRRTRPEASSGRLESRAPVARSSSARATW